MGGSYHHSSHTFFHSTFQDPCQSATESSILMESLLQNSATYRGTNWQNHHLFLEDDHETIQPIQAVCSTLNKTQKLYENILLEQFLWTVSSLTLNLYKQKYFFCVCVMSQHKPGSTMNWNFLGVNKQLVAPSQIAHPYGNSWKEWGVKKWRKCRLSHTKEGTVVGLWLLQLLFHIPLFCLPKAGSNTNMWITHCLPHTFIRVQLVSQPKCKWDNPCFL